MAAKDAKRAPRADASADATADAAATTGPVTPPNTEPTMVEVLAYYAAAGFDADMFVTEGGQLRCGTCQSSIGPDFVEVHSIRRLEGVSDPGEMSGVIALVCPVCRARATAVLRYGPESSPDDVALWQRMQDRRQSEVLRGDMAPFEDDPEVLPNVAGAEGGPDPDPTASADTASMAPAPPER